MAGCIESQGLHHQEIGQYHRPPSLIPNLTFLQVRLLHLSEPTHLVMAILGKKYPLNKEEWRAARLPGQFDPKRAGKRMALSVPETWETQVLFVYLFDASSHILYQGCPPWK